MAARPRVFSLEEQLNDLTVFLSYYPTDIVRKFLRLPPYYNRIAWFTGNQFGKTTIGCYEKVLRVFGTHPIPEKNFLYFECPNGHTFGRPTPFPGSHIFAEMRGKYGYCWHLGADKTKISNVIPFPQNLVCPDCGGKIAVHPRKTTIYRFCAENLPIESEGKGEESGEIKNRTYPELKKWLPSFLIKKDISQRNPSIRIADPNSGQKFGTGDNAIIYPGKDIIFEFVSYSQDVQATAGVQRLAVYSDEEPDYGFYKEQMSRLLSENGDFLLGLTPARKMTYTYETFYEDAEIYVRTDAIVKRYEEKGELDNAKPIEKYPERKSYKAVFQAATDDNPTLSKQSVERILGGDSLDEDDMDTRRYGIHAQASGRIYKNFNPKIHVVNGEELFPSGRPPAYWQHFRGIDYHPNTPWACGCCSLSPRDEMFIWFAKPFSPDKLTTLQIMTDFYHAGQDYQFKIHLVDPLAEEIKKDKITIRDDMNRISSELKREGIGMGGYWETWNTKGEHGRDAIKQRILNSRKVGRPFNNEMLEGGRTSYLPTMWIIGNPETREAIECMQKWAWQPPPDNDITTSVSRQNTPQQKYSHINMVWECLHKHPAFKFVHVPQHQERKYEYFKGAVAR